MADKTILTQIQTLAYRIACLKKDFLAAVGAGPTVNLANTLFVDPNGNDTAAIKGDIKRPWETLDSAASNAIAGDHVEVFKGDYEITNTDATSLGTLTEGTTTVSYSFTSGSTLNVVNTYLSGTTGTMISNDGVNDIDVIITGSPDIISDTTIVVPLIYNLGGTGGSISAELGNITTTTNADLQLGNGRYNYANVKAKTCSGLFRYGFSFTLGTADNQYHNVEIKKLEFTDSENGGFLARVGIGSSSENNTLNNIYASLSVDVLDANLPASNGCGFAMFIDSDIINFGTYLIKCKTFNWTSPTVGYIAPFTFNLGSFAQQGMLEVANTTGGKWVDSTLDIDISEIKGNKHILNFGENTTFERTSLLIHDGDWSTDMAICYFHDGTFPSIIMTDNSEIRFKNMKFTSTDSYNFDISEVSLDATSLLVFEDCKFTTGRAGESNIWIQAATSSPDRILFKNCIFINDGTAPCVSADAAVSISFVNCHSNSLLSDADVTELVDGITKNVNVK